MRRLIFSAGAKADLTAVREHIALDKPNAAATFVERLLSACASPLDHPEIGRMGRRRGTRELFTVPSYVIIYRVLPDTISVERVIHGARRR